MVGEAQVITLGDILVTAKSKAYWNIQFDVVG
jgi:hypothetical protein